MGPWGLDSFIGLIRILTTTGEAMHGTHHVPSIPLTDKHIKGKAYTVCLFLWNTDYTVYVLHSLSWTVVSIRHSAYATGRGERLES